MLNFYNHIIDQHRNDDRKLMVRLVRVDAAGLELLAAGGLVRDGAHDHLRDAVRQTATYKQGAS